MEAEAPRQSEQAPGSWEMKEKLGMGGFGHVYLYQHLKTGEKIAVKLCRLDLNAHTKDRWSREIEIMERLKHVNVVEAREVPKELLSIALNDLPLLAMEYCSRGDLRKVLTKPENCCGLKESEILALLKDIGAGIQYLHENKIIHRDLKPENIVLQDNNGKVIHKIIDLGYAKDLDQGSLCTSFVGTLQYLAPELFESKPYTLTVDYWSFGTVIFECICGFRPFLHNMQPVQWTSKVKNKGPKDIMAIEDMNGEVKFSAHLPYPNNLSKSFLEPIESLLQLLLLWDPEKRGGEKDVNNEKTFCFDILQNIIDMKIIHVLDMTSAKMHSLELSPEESLNSLELRLEAQTPFHISPLNQELLMETGISLDPEDHQPSVCQRICMAGTTVKSFYRVNFIVRETKTQLPLSALRKVWGEAVSYVCGLKEDYLLLYQGQRAAIKTVFFKSSIQHDLEMYTKQQQNGISSEKMLKTWQESEEQADNFTKVADASCLDEEIVGLHLEIVELQRSPYARKQEDTVKKCVEKVIELYKQLKAKCKSPDPPHGYSDSSEMVRAILQTVQNQDRVYRELYTHLSKILVFKKHITDLFPKLEKALENIATADAAVMQMQLKRQREFWYLLKIACAQTGSPPQSLQDSPSNNLTVEQLLDENQHCLSQLTSLMQDATRENETSVMDQDWSWTQYNAMKLQPQNINESK
ncbi:hypothetical protein WMY93_007185 [Mugilogobius chulae]|uniref:Inhibitor of nuclear factor kappa-B kinase subunit alpha n=1 Tax=Mugilogobius chulae TaxID=88201 RepID=A0AAW0PMV3_9GOBI